MCTALERPTTLECATHAQAMTWRKTCYTIRQVLEMIGDRRFKNLKLTIDEDRLLNAENIL